MAGSGGSIDLGIIETILELLNGLVDLIRGKGTSILTQTFDLVKDVSDQVSSLGDNLAADTRTLSDQMESSRVNLAQHIVNAVTDVNDHADENSSAIIKVVNDTAGQTNAKLDAMTDALSHLGEDIGKAIADNIGTIINTITQAESELTSKVMEGLNKLDSDITAAIAAQGAVFAQAIDHAADSIDKLTSANIEGMKLLHDELEDIRVTLSSSLKDHADVLDKAIRESAFGESTAITGVATAEITGALTIATAIESGCGLIAESIAASQAANKVLLGEKILKDVQVADGLISLLTAFGAITALDSPEAMAAILTPIVEAYYKVGKTITNNEQL